MRARTLQTIENTREADETIVQPGDEEVLADVADDEFAAHFNREQPPSLLVTTSRKPSASMFAFLTNLFETLPSATYYARRAFPLRKIVEHATSGGFTNLAVFNEDRTFSKGARVNGLLLVHLPAGPSAHFRLSNLVLSKDIKHHGRPTRHTPELILNNFTTALGHRVGRLFASLLPPAPQFAGRRVVTLHNQRDFIFFRHHRYVFEQKAASESDRTHTGHLAAATPPPPAGKRFKKKGAKKATATEAEEAPQQPARVKARLQELGPRFTLRLQVRDVARCDVGWLVCADALLCCAQTELTEGHFRPQARRVRVGAPAAGHRRRRLAPPLRAVSTAKWRWGSMVAMPPAVLDRAVLATPRGVCACNACRVPSCVSHAQSCKACGGQQSVGALAETTVTDSSKPGAFSLLVIKDNSAATAKHAAAVRDGVPVTTKSALLAALANLKRAGTGKRGREGAE